MTTQNNPGLASAPTFIAQFDAAPARQIPLGLTGLPTFEEIPTDEEIGKKPDGSPIFKTKRVPIEYWRKELVRAGHWTHRGKRHELTGEPIEFDITAEDIDDTVKNFGELKAAGVLPHLTDTHEFSHHPARSNGQIIDVAREGDSLFGTLKVVGESAIEKVLKNDVSVGLASGTDEIITDAFGKRYSGRVLQHVALTPNPNQPHLSPFVRIAASADGPAMSIPVFTLAAATPERRLLMKPETAKQFREKLGVAATVADDQLDEHAAQKALALSADVQKLTGELEAQKKVAADAVKERDAKASEVLALSADAPKRPDGVTLAMYRENINAKREGAIANGLAESEAKLIDSLLVDASNQPTTLALSACGTDKTPLAFNIWSVIGKIAKSRNGVKIDDGIERDEAALALAAKDGKEPPAKPMAADRKKELLQMAGYAG